jgi:murein DD-endopeptidase MepM/ murein hydrolase activator NlpD
MVGRLLIVCLLGVCSVIAAATPNPIIVELSRGETQQVRLSGGKTHSIKLISLKERTEPYYESANKRTIEAIVEADVTLRIDGKNGSVVGGPFRLPTVVNGLAVLVTVTKNWTGGIAPDELNKDVRLEIQDANVPWYDVQRFVFPIRNYRWRALNYQHTFLGVAVNQARIYYHRGEDFGMLPDREAAIATVSGKVGKVPGPRGDGASNSFFLHSAGLIFRYAHMNTPNILPEMKPGVHVTQGQKLGLTGNTWQGRPVRDPHLHVEIHDEQSNKLRNTFPWIVAAYRNSYPGELLPVAGGWRHLWAGDTIVLDGSRSLAGTGQKIVSWKWKFTDGTSATGAHVSRRYTTPGAYSEQLIVRDDRGREDSDFVEVYVLDREHPAMPPFTMIHYYPVRGIHAGDEVEFVIRPNKGGPATIDYGDNAKVAWSETTHHRYAHSGTYIVTVSKSEGPSGPGIFKARVVVE